MAFDPHVLTVDELMNVLEEPTRCQTDKAMARSEIRRRAESHEVAKPDVTTLEAILMRRNYALLAGMKLRMHALWSLHVMFLTNVCYLLHRLTVTTDTTHISRLTYALQTTDWITGVPQNFPSGLLNARELVLKHCGIQLQRK